MKLDPVRGGPIWAAWNAGGLLAGTTLRTNAVVTVEPAYQLNVFDVPGYGAPGYYTLNPVRWYQRANGSQIEVIVPNVVSIATVKSLDADADTATIIIDNTWMNSVTAQSATELGAPGFFTPQRGADVGNRWGHTPNFWAGVLGRNALIRTYEGFGGYGKTLKQALIDGNLVKTGTWLVDDPQVGTNGLLTLVCRSMAKLLVDQQVYPPLVPPAIYPIQFSRFWYREENNPTVLYGNSYTTGDLSNPPGPPPQKDIVGMALTSVGDGYWLVGNDGGIFSYGNTFFHGSLGKVAVWYAHPTAPPFQARCVGMARSPDNPNIPPDRIGSPGQGDEIMPASGYWMVLNTGEVFSFGDANYHGGEYFGGLDCIGIMRSGNADGYWLIKRNGAIFSFGAAPYCGGTPPLSGRHITGFSSTPTGQGYWMCDEAGHVFTYGDARYYGGISFALGGAIVGMASTPSGNGYYMVGADGGVFCFGDAIYHGSIPGGRTPATFFDWNLTAGSTVITGSFSDFLPSDVGASLSEFNNVHIPVGAIITSYIDANHVRMSVPAPFSANGVVGSVMRPIQLADAVCGISVFPDGGNAALSGYWLVAKDGGIFSFNVPFHGSMAGLFLESVPYDGNYKDLTDIIKYFALWCGFNLYDGVNANVYGNMETTGIYSTTILDPTVFDKAPVIDGLKKIRDVVGYLLYVDDDGALHFEEPNFWGHGGQNVTDLRTAGNRLSDGTWTASVPVIDEKVQLTDYQLSQPDTNLLSAVIVASQDPALNTPGTVFRTVVPTNAVDLKGMTKPALYVNQIFVNQGDVDTMAQLIADHIGFKAHIGAVKCLGNPLITVNDQVQILERQSAEMGIHWIRGISATHDLKTGAYEMTLTTSYLSSSITSWTGPLHPGLPFGATVVHRP